MNGRSFCPRRGGVIRTYGRRQPLRSVRSQHWLSPCYQQHLFSTSSSASSLFSSSAETSADPDFQPVRKKTSKRNVTAAGPASSARKGSRSRANKRKAKPAGYQGRLRTRKKRSPSPPPPEPDEGKENEAAADLSCTPPAQLGKFITHRRRAASRRGQKHSSAAPPRRDSAGSLSVPKKRRKPLETCAVIGNLPLLCSTPAQPPVGGPVHARPSRSVAQVLEESLLHGSGEESVAESWKMNPFTPSSSSSSSHNLPQLRAERSPLQTCCLSDSKSVISLASRGSCHGFCQSAELFSQVLDVNGSEGMLHRDIAGTSPSVFQHPSTCKGRDSNVLFINEQKVYLQPVVCLHKCVVSPRQAQPSGQERSKVLNLQDQSKPSEISTKDLSGTKHLCRNASGHFSSQDTSHREIKLSQYQANCFQSEGGVLEESNQDNSCSVKVSRKLDMCSADRNHTRMDMFLQKTKVNSVRASPLLTDSQKTAVSQMVVSSDSRRALPADGIGTERKVCISGFSSKRWGKRTRTRPKKIATKTVREKERNCSFKKNHVSLLDYGLKLRKYNEKRQIRDIATENIDTLVSRLESASLLNSSFMNSSAFQNLSQDSSCLQYWTRLRASLSLHKKKKVKIQGEVEVQELTDSSIERSYLGAPATSQLSTMKTPLGRQLSRYQPLSGHSMSLLTPMKCSLLCEDLLTDAEKVYEECQQDQAISFLACIPPDKMHSCEKIGEGVFGEVFKTISNGDYVALKIIPIEGSSKVNGEFQKSFGEILPEIIISRELSLLCEGSEDSTDGFIKLHSVHCVKGSYPPHLLQAWDTFDKNRGSENDSPALFRSDQLFIILEFEFGGNDLESMRNKLTSVSSAKSILHQVTVALAVAEETLRFEHRDLHWGNVLVKQTNVKMLKYNLHGSCFEIPTHGVQASIIDYTLSRLEKDGLTVYCDIAADETLFQGQGDYQFDVYRSMRQENANSWSEYHPHSNVLWLHYLANKLIKEIRYQKKTTTSAMKGIHRKLVQFHNEVLRFVSAFEVLHKSSLFK